MRRKVSQKEIEKALHELKKYEQKVAVFKSEKLSVSKEAQQISDREKEELYQQKLRELHNGLKHAIKNVKKIINKLKKSLRAGQQDERRLKKTSLKNRENAGNKSIDEAARYQRSDNQKIMSWLRKLESELQSAQNVKKKEAPGIADPKSSDNWINKYDNNGPFLKYKNGTEDEPTIHFDDDHNITASHIKHADGSKSYANPSDIFLTEAFANSFDEEEEEVVNEKKFNSRDFSLHKHWSESDINLEQRIESSNHTDLKSSNSSLDEDLNFIRNLRNNYEPFDPYQFSNQEQQLYSPHEKKVGFVDYNNQVKDNIGNTIGEIDNANQNGPVLKDELGNKNKILLDGTIINQYGAQTGRISNYESPFQNKIEYINNRVSGNLNKTMDYIGSNQLGSGYYGQ